MDSLDINTRLPPRKRLLAGLRKESSDCELSLPFPPVSTELCARLRDVINSTTSSPEEIIEASKSVALAATALATKARATAMEKAEAAAKAKAAAKSALELLDSISMNEACKLDYPNKNRSRKKHVQIKLLYEDRQPAESHKNETDEEVARRLHRAMNSSPRISNNSNKRHATSQELVVSDGGEECNGKLEKRVPVCFKPDFFDGNKEPVYSIEMQHHGPKKGGIAVCKKSKLKQKKLPLSQCNIRDQGRPKERSVSLDNGLAGQLELHSAETNMPLTNAKPLDESEVSKKITTMWKCKKFKVSQCYADSKILHSTKTAAMVKVD